MASADAEKLTLQVDGGERVSALLIVPPRASACYVLAHGVGVGMTHPSMTTVAEGLAERRIATLRYQFPFVEKGTGRPDSPKVAQAAVRAAVEEARRRVAKLPLVAGGRSFGGRMTSQAQASEPLPGARGLAFLAFPLHAAGRPSHERAAHLFDVQVPMLFLQGTRDALADLSLLEPLCKRLGKRAKLELFADADHSFHVPARTGRTDAEVRAAVLDALAAWVATVTRS